MEINEFTVVPTCMTVDSCPLRCASNVPQLSVGLINDVGNEMHCIFRHRPTNLAITAIPKHYFRWKIALNAMNRNGSSVSHLCLMAVKPWTMELSLPIDRIKFNLSLEL